MKSTVYVIHMVILNYWYSLVVGKFIDKPLVFIKQSTTEKMRRVCYSWRLKKIIFFFFLSLDNPQYGL